MTQSCDTNQARKPKTGNSILPRSRRESARLTHDSRPICQEELNAKETVVAKRLSTRWERGGRAESLFLGWRMGMRNSGLSKEKIHRLAGIGTASAVIRLDWHLNPRLMKKLRSTTPEGLDPKENNYIVAKI